MALTDAKARALAPRDKRYKVADGHGLILVVETTGRKVWRFRYTVAGKERVIVLGDFPAMGLASARAKVAELQDQRRAGLDPALEADRARVAAATGSTFRDVAEAYMHREAGHWSESHAARFRHRMQRDVLPVIGSLDVGLVRPVDVSRAVLAIEDRGAQNTANRVVGMIGQVLQFGVARGLCEQDVTLHMRRGLPRAPRPKHRAAVLDRAELGQLLDAIWTSPSNSIAKPLVQMIALTFQRPGEVRHMRWSDVDRDARLWRYRVSKVGLDHAVPLCPDAIAILDGLRPLTGREEFVFHSRASRGGVVSDVMPTKFLGRIGWGDRQTAHGFRAIARTVLAEDLGFPPALIEQQLSHGVPDPHGRSYNRTLFLEQRRRMMDAWGAHLAELRQQVESSAKSHQLNVNRSVSG
jgi:integrase